MKFFEFLTNNNEVWRTIENFNNYEVSNLGNVRIKETKEKVGFRDKNDNLNKVNLTQDGRKKTTTIGKLVAETFNLENKTNKLFIRHKNGIKTDDRLENLTYDINECKRVNEYSDKKRIDDEELKSKTSNETKEIWKWVIGYERWYEISNYGNVRKINDDGTKKILKIGDGEIGKRGRVVGLRTTDKYTQFSVSHLVAEAFNIPKCEANSTIVYHIDGDINNDCLSNLTYDKKETDEYKKQQRLEEEKRRKEEKKAKLYQKTVQRILSKEDEEFLKQAKEINQKREKTLNDIYDKLNEILEVLKNGNR